ncbi:glycerol-3-phosphate dehydrogenase/oxidase [Limibacter armeniacum]|uniref:glycerol-3-phosphate dehydrogenase/oxidase n=1 Tax=Limibacter armeniacum TaxID=466084 RepID=UPI002FE603F2
MKRSEMLDILKESQENQWDVLVIGGGASGLGVAYDSAMRSYKTILLEQADFAKGTSSRSTKLVHGGVRYLAQGDVTLVREALVERGLLRENAPHLVSNQAFIIPTYDWWETPYYAAGLKVYDMMAGNLGLGPSEQISKEETLEAIPNLNKDGLTGGIIYYDGQFDDARLAISLAQSAVDYEGVLVNYMKVVGLMKDTAGNIVGAVAKDMESGEEFQIKAKVVINATGVFVDDILKMDNPSSEKTIQPSQGVHIVLDKHFLQGDTAIMIPKTDDGRVLFAVPWHQKVVVGTTDTPLEKLSLEPRALEAEIDFILQTAGKYLVEMPKPEDVLSVFAGLRPLAVNNGDTNTHTKGISRSHKLIRSTSNLLSIVGGKWTTFRKMGEDVMDTAVKVGKLHNRKSITKNALIHGYTKRFEREDPLHVYGNDQLKIRKKIELSPYLGEKLHPNLPYLKAQVVWAVEEEMARTVEDVLARRTRALLLDAKASIEIAPAVAEIMASLLKKDKDWEIEQVNEYTELAHGYMIDQYHS